MSAEGVRMLNLLSGLGENSVVIRSTHVDQHMRPPCTEMAIVDEWKILQEPKEAS